MSIDEQKMQENREQRRKRRKKAQIQAFAVLGGALIVVALLGMLLYMGISSVIKAASKDNGKEVVKKQETTASDTAKEQDKEADAEPEGGASEDTQQTETESGDTETEESTEKEIPLEERQAQILDSYVQNILNTMTLEEKVAGLFLVTPQNITGVPNAYQAGSSTNAAMNEYAIGGMLYDEKNMRDREQFSQMVYNTRGFSKVELFIAVSDEGGENSPLSLGGLREEVIPGQAQIAAEGGSAGAYSAGISKSSQFRGLGINLNLAPVADVAVNEKSVIAQRSYGNNAANVLSCVKSEVKGMTDQGVDCCLKYFPGQGDVTGDTQTAKVVSKRTKQDLENTEFAIYREMIAEGIPMIMVSHVSMPEITGDDTPASLSSVMITDILRGELGFNGVVITDYMNKAAITKHFKHADSSAMAIEAGADMIAVPGDFKKAYNGLLKAVKDGEITEERINESMMRILRMKYKSMVDYGEGTEDTENADADAE